VTRFLSTLALDARLQFRGGFYAASAFVAVCLIVLLSGFSAENAAVLLPPLLLGAVMTNTFYFVAGLVLLERTEGTLIVQRATPLRDYEYLASKILTLSALTLAECLSISGFAVGFGAQLFGQALGILLASALLGLTGIIVVVWYESINQFLFPSVLYTLLLSLPVLGYFEVGPRAWYLPHPLQGPMELLQGTPSSLAYATFYPLLWLIPLCRSARRALPQACTA
jgi:fluoroquinolone transport system permease protein